MNFDRLYSYRFRDIDQAAREAVWRPIAKFIHDQMGNPSHVLDPAAGRCEFINAISAEERWAIDMSSYEEAVADPGVKVVVADVLSTELPSRHFDGIFISNFLEHLPNQEAVATFLEKMCASTKQDGTIAVMGPNIRYCAKDYWNCADHEVALTHEAVEEHLYAAGFEPVRTYPRFLPYSFRGVLPPSPKLTSLYLRARPAWRILGKQFLVIGKA